MPRATFDTRVFVRPVGRRAVEGAVVGRTDEAAESSTKTTRRRSSEVGFRMASAGSCGSLSAIFRIGKSGAPKAFIYLPLLANKFECYLEREEPRGSCGGKLKVTKPSLDWDLTSIPKTTAN